MKKKVVALLGTLDSKGAEYAFLKKQIEAQGVDTLVIDAGVLADPRFKPDVPAAEVAKAGGGDVAALEDRERSGQCRGRHGSGSCSDRQEAA